MLLQALSSTDSAAQQNSSQGSQMQQQSSGTVSEQRQESLTLEGMGARHAAPLSASGHDLVRSPSAVPSAHLAAQHAVRPRGSGSLQVSKDSASSPLSSLHSKLKAKREGIQRVHAGCLAAGSRCSQVPRHAMVATTCTGGFRCGCAALTISLGAPCSPASSAATIGRRAATRSTVATAGMQTPPCMVLLRPGALRSCMEVSLAGQLAQAFSLV